MSDHVPPFDAVTLDDGKVAEVLDEAGMCQVVPGPHASVAEHGAEPARTLHVGDSGHHEMEGARAAGMAAVHFDPRRLYGADDHPHIRALADLPDG